MSKTLNQRKDISISLAKIIVFHFVIKQETSPADLEGAGGVYFHLVWGNLVKSQLSKGEFIRWENRLVPVPEADL